MTKMDMPTEAIPYSVNHSGGFPHNVEVNLQKMLNSIISP